jgi:hypothetical protein
VAEEEDDVLAGLDDLAEYVLRPTRGIEEHGVGLLEVVEFSDVSRPAHGSHRQEFDGEVGVGLEFLQFVLDAFDLGVGVLLGLNASPTTANWSCPGGGGSRTSGWA